MRFKAKHRKVGLVIGLSAGVVLGCSKKSSTESGSGEAAIETTDVASLGLSGALSIDVPDSVAAASGSSLALAGGTKSAEACRIRSNVKEGIRALEEVGSMFCHFEAESDKIVYGKKINVTFEGGSASGDGAKSFQVWIDDSDKANGVLVVNFCKDRTLSEQITITGSKDGHAKGTMTSVGSETREGAKQTWKRSIKFDSGYTVEGRTVLVSKGKFTSGDDEFARLLALDLVSDGVSKLFVAERGGGNSGAGAALIGPKFGMAVYKGEGSYDGSTFDFSTRGYFNGKGSALTVSASPKFADGEELFVSDSMVPGLLPANFSPDGFSADTWDCSTDEEVTLNPESSAHKACDNGKDKFDQENCWGDDYQQGEDHPVKDSKRPDAETFDVDPAADAN